MTFSELDSILKNGPLAIEFNAGVLDSEGYAEPNMRAKITALSIHHGDIAVVFVDYSEFEDFNKAFETRDFFDSNGVACLTARSSGNYFPQDTIYLGVDDDFESVFSSISTLSIDTHNEFKATGQNNYVKWLEEQLALERNSK